MTYPPPFSRHGVRMMAHPPRGWQVGWWIETAFKHNASEASILSVLRDPELQKWVKTTSFGEQWAFFGPYIDDLVWNLEVIFDESPDGRIGKVYHARPVSAWRKRSRYNTTYD